jgi:replication-associated recombination protein RarA
MIVQNRLKRAVSVDQMESMKFKTMQFEADWLESFGTPGTAGAWIIWGNTGNGKTTFALRLAKYLSNFDTVAYNTIEEGLKLSFQQAVKAANMKEVKNKFKILDGESVAELRYRLRKNKSPNIIFIDSVQYTNLTRETYKALLNDFPKKLFIFISHAEGTKPKGKVADAIAYDADVKIRIEGYRAYPISRFGGNQPFTIKY